MPELLGELRERLLRAGIAPRHVRRYLGELSDHLSDLAAEAQRAGMSRADADTDALRRLGGVDDLSRAMIGRPELRSWSASAPWAVFAVAPLGVLLGAYAVACFILWSGWRFFLPGEVSPFVRLHGPAVLYFGVGRWLYFLAPVLTCWAVGILALRQRLRWAWPAAGWLLVALMGALAHLRVDFPSGTGAAGVVRMSFAPGNSWADLSGELVRAAATLFLALIPLLVSRKGEPRPA